MEDTKQTVELTVRNGGEVVRRVQTGNCVVVYLDEQRRMSTSLSIDGTPWEVAKLYTGLWHLSQKLETIFPDVALYAAKLEDSGLFVQAGSSASSAKEVTS